MQCQRTQTVNHQNGPYRFAEGVVDGNRCGVGDNADVPDIASLQSGL